MYKYKSPPRDSNPLLFNHERKKNALKRMLPCPRWHNQRRCGPPSETGLFQR